MLIAGFKDHIGISRADVENWLPKLATYPGTTKFAETKPGAPRDYSRENVLELATIAAMRKAGCSSLQTAASYAAMVRRHDQIRHLKQWLVFPAGNFTQGTGTDNPAGVPFEDLAEKSPNRTVALIHIGKIVETVDRLFGGEGGS